MPAQVVIGIDPGKSGAIAIYRPKDHVLTVWDAPLLANPKGKTETDLHGLLYILRVLDGPVMAVLEQASPRPGEGSVGAFSFGRGYGAIQMALAIHGHQVRMVTPSVWKRHFGLIFAKGTPKAQIDRKSTRLNSSHSRRSRMPSSA